MIDRKKRTAYLAAGAVGLISFALGWVFDLLPFRLNDLGLAVSGRTALHALSGLLTAAVALAIFWCVRREGTLFRAPWRQMLLLLVLLNAVTALYVLTTRTVFVWDNAGYWSVARSLAAERLGRAQVRAVLESTVTKDYNYLLAFPVSLVMRLIGTSRAVFVFSISNLYTLPALWGLAAMFRERRWGGLILAGCFPMLVYIGCVGYVDTAACAAAIWAAHFFRNGEGRPTAGILTGLCLCLTFLLRRYFFFFACAFCAAAALEWLLLERRFPRRQLILAAAFALSALYFTPNFLIDQVVRGGLADLYSAYSLALRYDLLLTSRYFGLAVLLALLVPAVLCILRGQNRADAVFALIQFAVCYVAFVLVQTHGQQHLLMYVPALALLVRAAAGESRRILPAAAAVVTLWCFVPKAQPGSIQEIPYPAPLPSFTFYGPRREDVDALLALETYIDGLSAERPARAAVLASSFTFNSETLTNLRPSLNLPEPEKRTEILYQGTVDRVNGLNWSIFAADYLIVGDPVQTHLGEENQAVIACLAHDLLDGTGIGAAYEPLPETFALQNGVTVRIYRLARPLTDGELRLVSDRLLARYPDFLEYYGLP